MAAVYTMHLDAGATFTRQFEYTDADGTPADLTGYTALMHIRATVDAGLALAVTPTIDVPTGVITVTIPAADTSTLVLPEYIYALELTAGGGEPVLRLVQGKIIVSPEVVRA